MSPEKALQLVTRYAELTKKLKQLTSEISNSLDRCRGVSGNRGKHAETLEELMAFDDNVDEKGREKDLHLWNWYQPERAEYDQGPEWAEITLGEHGEECCHCYNAHLAIQQRKLARKELGHVKGAMSRSAP